MVTFYEKNSRCMEQKQKADIQVNLEDSITWYDYKIRAEPRKRSEIPDRKWDEVINNENALLIVDKHKRNQCYNEKVLKARDDVCHIIGMWYTILLREYNRDMPDNRRIEHIGSLYHNITNGNQKIWDRVHDIIGRYGMTFDDVSALYTYKLQRNNDVHDYELHRGSTTAMLSQQERYAIGLLRLAPDQEEDFPPAFERIVRWVYRRN